MSQFIELDFELENEILEWSEEYNVNNEALFSLIEILKLRWPSQNTLNKTSKKIDQGTQSDFSNSIVEVVNSFHNNNLRECLEDLKLTQNVILKEVIAIRNESNCHSNDTNSSFNEAQHKRLFDFPITNLKHFQLLENFCAENAKLYQKMMEIFLSNSKTGKCTSVEDFLNENFNMIIEHKLILYLTKFFDNVQQLESCSIFRCLKDASLEKFSSPVICKNIFTTMLLCLKKLSIEQSLTTVNKIIQEECYEEPNHNTNSDDCLALALEFISLDLPCNTIKDLLKFEEQSKEFNFALISLFKSGPQTDCKSLVNFVMKKIFGEKIINDIEWENFNGLKTEIRNFHFIETFIDYIDSLQKFDEGSCEDDIREIIIDWLKQEQNFTNTQENTIKINQGEGNIIEFEMMESSNSHSNDNHTQEPNADEILEYNEEFLEEEDNLFNLLPCKTDNLFRKFEEACRLDSNFQEKLRELFISTHQSDITNYKDENDFDEIETCTEFNSHDTQDDFKRFIEYSIRKIATDEVISNFTSNIDKETEDEIKETEDEILNCEDILIFRILRECVQQTFPNLSPLTIRNEITAFIKKTKKNYKNWNIIKKVEECRMKLDNIPPQDVITPNSHSIHLQSIFNLPINSLDSLQDFNTKCLNDEEMSLNLMSMFLQVSECYDCNKFVDKNLRKLITENVGGKLTWNGIQENIAIKDLYIMKLLIDATKKHFRNRSEESIIDSIKLALRRFKDRIRKRKSSFPMTENLADEDFKICIDLPIQNDEEIDSDIINLNKIPCRTINEFQNFEKCCRKYKDLQMNLKNLFDSNPNVKDAVKFISENLKKVVVDSALGHFTYNGLKNNIGVKYYTIIRILMDSLIGKDPYLSEEDAIKSLKKALLLAKDRQRSMYKKRRKENSE